MTNARMTQSHDAPVNQAALEALHAEVVRTSPVGAILGRPVPLTHGLEVETASEPA